MAELGVRLPMSTDRCPRVGTGGFLSVSHETASCSIQTLRLVAMEHMSTMNLFTQRIRIIIRIAAPFHPFNA